MKNKVEIFEFYGNDEAIHLIKKDKTKYCGIYKITNLNNKVYIGESINIYVRFLQYMKLSIRIKSQNKIYNSLSKYGPSTHKFEILELCNKEELKCKERYWQDYYNVLGENGLNLKLTECGEIKQIHSDITKIKISKTRKKLFTEGKLNNNLKNVKRGPCKEEAKIKISKANSGEKNGMYGRKEEECHKINRMKNLHSKEKWNKGLSKENNEKIKQISDKLKGRIVHNKIPHKLTNIATNEVWEANSLYELSLICDISLSTLNRLKINKTGKKLKSKYKLEKT